MVKTHSCGGILNKRIDDNGSPIWYCGLCGETSKRNTRKSAKARAIDELLAELGEIA